jgi:glucoamylase
MNEHSAAFGAPGIEPRWTSSAKDGIGTAYNSGSRVWFTLSHGIVNEIYFPHVDTPNTRDLQFLITDGKTFCHEEKRDLLHALEHPEKGALLYKQINSDRAGRYRLVKEIITDPHSPVLLMHTRLEIIDPELRGNLRVYALLAPHLNGTGKNNSAWWCNVDGRKLFDVQHEGMDMSLGCVPDFTRRSVGYVGASDGWQDLSGNFKMDWEFSEAVDGNIALTGEIDLSVSLEFTIGVGFGHTPHSASAHLVQAFATPFEEQRAKYVAQWKRRQPNDDLSLHTRDGGRLLWLSHSLLLAHEDKSFQGAFVASLSIPWGESRDDTERGGYHLVWPRDMVQTATALLACGETESALRALIWLACVQAADGSLPQNSRIDGAAFWTGLQLDEVAAPILLAWRLKQAKALRLFDPWPMVSRAACFLILRGPVTSQERWEECSGYSPSTLAMIIAALVCAAEFARDKGDTASSFLLDYADWLEAHLNEWMVTQHGELVPGKPRHFIRITPASPEKLSAIADPDNAEVSIANGGGKHSARNVVGGDFLHLVRLGIRDAHDPVILDSIAVLDTVLKRDLPQGPCWRRYNHDGYGDKPDGSAFDGTGEGRSWPLLTGERAHYELAAGRDPSPFIEAIEKFAGQAGMLPEQLWDAEDRPDGRFTRGGPGGSAMPLCWAHAEYVSLVRSRKDGKPFDQIDLAHQRYVEAKGGTPFEIWTLAHQPRQIGEGKVLRVVLDQPATIHWSMDQWRSLNDTELHDTGLGCWFADLPSTKLKADDSIVFTLLLKTGWLGSDYALKVVDL